MPDNSSDRIRASARTRLFLVGGGLIPPEAADRFLQACATDTPRILLSAWASNVPRLAAQTIAELFAVSNKAVQVDLSAGPPRTAAGAETFLRKLERADGIFFGGGSQSRYLRAMEKFPEIAKALHSRFAKGMPVGGTSAGTAIMSHWAIERGEYPNVVVGRGLGLVTECLVDQHFEKRQRQDRLLWALAKTQTKLGLGIDEDAAVVVYDGRWIEAFGHASYLFGAAPERLVLVPGATPALIDLTAFRLNDEQLIA